MDSIHINGLRLFAYHGVNPEEKQQGQYFMLDLLLYVDLERACRSDELGDTVSYSKAAKTAARVFCAQPFNLIERAAGEVADALLEEYPAIRALSVTVKKPDAPVKLDFDCMAVRIFRRREEEPPCQAR